MNANRVLSLLPFTAMSVAFGLSIAACSQSGPPSGPATPGSGGTSTSSPNDSGKGGNTAKTSKTSASSSRGGTTSTEASAEGGSTSAEGGAGTEEGGSDAGGASSSKSAAKTGGAGGKGSSSAVGSNAGGTRSSSSGACSGSSCSSGGSSAGGTVSTSATTTVPNGGATVCGAEHFKDFASGKTPKEVGLKLAKLFDSQAVDTSKHYKTACTWWGALTVTGLLEDATLLSSLTKKFDQLVPNFVATSTERNHVDDNVFGIVPLEIFLQNGDKAIRDLGLALADHQIENIDDPNQVRNAIDDMFMITGLQVQAYRAADAANKAKYLDIAADTMVKYLAMQKDDGCFYQKEGANAKWGRGNGWFAVGMAEMMRALPSTHKHYATIRSGYEKMMKGLLDYQIKSGEGAGIWYQVIDSKDARNWPETSGSAMFTYAMITGVKLCILDAATYGPAAFAAWNTLTDSKYLGADGKLKEISDWCYWQPSEGDALDYYITVDGRGRVVGDGHGQGPMLWSATALLW